jgi:hypothetical protein
MAINIIPKVITAMLNKITKLKEIKLMVQNTVITIPLTVLC